MSVCLWLHRHTRPINKQLWLCRLTLHPTSFPLLLKHTAQGLIHSSWPPYASPDPSPLGAWLHSSSSPCSSPSSTSSSCASHSSLPSKSRSTPHRATADPFWPFFLLSISCPAAQLVLHAHTHPHRKQTCGGGSVLRAGSWVTSEARWKSRKLMVGDTPSGCTWLSWTQFHTLTHTVYIQYIIFCFLSMQQFVFSVCISSAMYVSRLHAPDLSSCWACCNLTKQILEQSWTNWRDDK